MKKRTIFPVLAAVTVSGMLCLSACEADLTNINEEEIALSVEVEEENLLEGFLIMHSVWYDAAGNLLPQANIAFYDGSDLVCSGTTDADGVLETCNLPSNTALTCTVTSSSGTLLAQTDLIIKISEDFSSLVIYPPTDADPDTDEVPTCTVELPPDKAHVHAALFVTNEGAVSVASMTPYVDETAELAEETPEEEEVEEAEEVEEVEETVAEEEADIEAEEHPEEESEETAE